MGLRKWRCRGRVSNLAASGHKHGSQGPGGTRDPPPRSDQGARGAGGAEAHSAKAGRQKGGRKAGRKAAPAGVPGVGALLPPAGQGEGAEGQKKGGGAGQEGQGGGGHAEEGKTRLL